MPYDSDDRLNHSRISFKVFTLLGIQTDVNILYSSHICTMVLCLISSFVNIVYHYMSVLMMINVVIIN